MAKISEQIVILSESEKPHFRKLRAYAFDPSLSLKMDTASINDITYKVPWEELNVGPVGEYVEVIDYDPTVKRFYLPVDLNARYPLAQDGLDPSESNPKFHQQMVYAVAMTTINNFEKALGRKILWAPRRLSTQEYEEYVQRIRIYPHAFRDANAFYSPIKKALMFGYFSSVPADETLHMPDALVFTCLSHDIIAHEVTHAILDGLHRHYNEPTNADVLAFHEAFADIVALFQHFTFPEVLKHQIAKTRGDLTSQNLLGELAQEFGSAIGGYGSLRDAIGGIDPETKKWKMKEPSPEDYRIMLEPHARGSILVAAVFEAFIRIYENRVADLLRIASGGTGELPLGDLHPDLVNRLADEASRSAGQVLKMCIRALDYCPPVDITFGDYLRAIITADVDLVSDDRRGYRLAFIEAFRRRGIFPEGIKTLSVESLCQPAVNLRVGQEGITLAHQKLSSTGNTEELLRIINKFLRDYGNAIKYVGDRREIYNVTKDYIAGGKTTDPDSGEEKSILGLHQRLNIKFSRSTEFERITGLAFVENPAAIGIRSSSRYAGPSFQIQNLRSVSRVTQTGTTVNQVIFSIVQRSGVIYENDRFKKHYQPVDPYGPHSQPLKLSGSEMNFEFRGGCTLIFDLDNLQLKYAISKPLLEIENDQPEPRIDQKRADRQYHFQQEYFTQGFNQYAQYFGGPKYDIIEPFSFLHQH